MCDEIRPSRAEIGADEHWLVRQVQLRGRDHVFIERVDGAEIAEVPVEFGAAFEHTGGDGGHYDVAAVSGVARDREFPCVLSSGGNTQRERHERSCH